MGILLGTRTTPVIQTRQCHTIVCERLFRLDTNQIRAHELQQREEHPSGLQLVVRKRPNSEYNCHGLTFLNRRAWLSSVPNVDMILDDDHYDMIEPHNVIIGDIAIYYEMLPDMENKTIIHTGVVVGQPEELQLSLNTQLSVYSTTELERKFPWVLSKWGSWGEYIHRANYGPYMNRKPSKIKGEQDSYIIRYMREGKND